METTGLITTIGICLLLIAFFLQSFKLTKTMGYVYALLNLSSTAIAGNASWLTLFIPFVKPKVVWRLVAIFGLTKLYTPKMFHVKLDGKTN